MLDLSKLTLDARKATLIGYSQIWDCLEFGDVFLKFGDIGLRHYVEKTKSIFLKPTYL